MFFSLWRLVRPRQDGERAWPLAKMLLGAKLGGRPPIVSRIIVHVFITKVLPSKSYEASYDISSFVRFVRTCIIRHSRSYTTPTSKM